MIGNGKVVDSPIDPFPPGVSGVFFYALSMAGAGNEEQSLTTLSGKLLEAGVLVHWITFDTANASCPFGVPAGVKWIRLAEPLLTRLEPRSAPAQASRLADLLEFLTPPVLLCWGDASFPSAFLASKQSGTALALFRLDPGTAAWNRIGLLNICLSGLAFLFSGQICLPRAEDIQQLPFFLRRKATITSNVLTVVTRKPGHRYRFHILARPLISALFLITAPFRYRRHKKKQRVTAEAVAAIFDSAWYMEHYAPAPSSQNALQHYLALGQYLGYDPHPLFWSTWYLNQHPGVAPMNPWLHYHSSGYRLGCNPNPFFHSNWYQTHAGIGEDTTPLLHYLTAPSSSAPNALFDAGWYRATYIGGKLCHTTLLEDFLASTDGRPSHPLFLKHVSLSQDTQRNRLDYKDIFSANLDYRALHAHPVQATTRKRFALCSVITGDYDHPLEVRHKDPNIAYFLLTDRPLPLPPGWDAMIVSPSSSGTPLKHSRYLKMSLFQIIPHALDYEAIAYIDGNIQIVGTLEHFFDTFLWSGQHLGLVPHPYRYSAYQEAATILLWNRDLPENVRNTIGFLEQENFPEDTNLFEMNFFLARPTPEACAFFADWWSLFDRYGNRDQLLAPYVLWKRGLDHFPLFPPPLSVRDHPAFVCKHHV